MTELRPCPFPPCDGKPNYDTDGVMSWVKCLKCNATGPIKDMMEEAIAAWNRRQPCADCGRKAITEILEFAQDQAEQAGAYGGAQNIVDYIEDNFPPASDGAKERPACRPTWDKKDCLEHQQAYSKCEKDAWTPPCRSFPRGSE